MNTTIYLASYGDFNDNTILKAIFDYFTQNISKEKIEMIAPLGGKNGDITCRNYTIKNNLKYRFLKPSEIIKPNILQQCNHAILFNNGKSKGINIQLKILPKYIIGKIVEVDTDLNSLTIYQTSKEPITKHYQIKNGKLELT